MRRRANEVAAWTAFSNVERTLLFIGSLLCGLACIGIGSRLGIPREPHFNGSLLAGGAAISGMVVALISIAVCLAIGWVVATFIEAEAGLFCCCMGLAALGVRCGPIRPVLQYATGPKIFPTLALEVGLLGVFLIASWLVLQKAIKMFSPSDLPNTAAPNEVIDPTLQQKLTALGAQIVATGIFEQILIQTDAKAQAMAGVFIAAFIGSVIAYNFTPLAEGIWYWAGPVVLGCVGYLLASSNTDGLLIGDLRGWTAPLARATPLDYVGMGTAGALVGYWCMRRWAQPEEGDSEPEMEEVRQPTVG